MRTHTLSIVYTLAGYKHASRNWIRTSTIANWLKYTSYILGDTVATWAMDDSGRGVCATWGTVLRYEYQVRKLMARKVLFEAKSFIEAMTEAMADEACRTRYLVTPTAFIQCPDPLAFPPLLPTRPLQVQNPLGPRGSKSRRP